MWSTNVTGIVVEFDEFDKMVAAIVCDAGLDKVLQTRVALKRDKHTVTHLPISMPPYTR